MDGRLEFSTVKDVVLFVLAIYAAALSTWNLVQALRKDRRLVRVTAGTKVPVIGSELGSSWAHLQAINIGQRAVTISVLSFEVAPGKRIFNFRDDGRPDGMVDTPLPSTISDGQSVQAHFSYKDIGQAMISSGLRTPSRLVPVCEDSAGGIHRGEAWEVDPIEFLSM
ncbi:MAG: hypothetical protein HZA66_21795 [Rhodopseudomonas palustris]|uniref:Uncharacterized protein n=1 Tax=Rhodopseudomonas palustris TaxID=1076 RepID=A0A933S0G0_RHOPL|nr:hypothetical protein [Rhodopseudomonas palustris]